jgi:hypothetical protein
MSIDEEIYREFCGVDEDSLTVEEKEYLIRQYGDRDWKSCAGIRSTPEQIHLNRGTR